LGELFEVALRRELAHEAARGATPATPAPASSSAIPEPASVAPDPLLAAAAAVAAAEGASHGDATPAHAEDRSAADGSNDGAEAAPAHETAAARPVETSTGSSGPNRAVLVEFFRSRRAKRQASRDGGTQG
jgi:hypothetical protein